MLVVPTATTRTFRSVTIMSAMTIAAMVMIIASSVISRQISIHVKLSIGLTTGPMSTVVSMITSK
jgi:hypothetical protein